MKLLPFDQRLQFHLSHPVDQANPEECAEDLILMSLKFHVSDIWLHSESQSESIPADQRVQGVRGTLLILHLLSGRTDPADLWDQAHHLHPEEITTNERFVDAVGPKDTEDTMSSEQKDKCKLDTYSRTRSSNRPLWAGGTRWTLWRREKFLKE